MTKINRISLLLCLIFLCRPAISYEFNPYPLTKITIFDGHQQVLRSRSAGTMFGPFGLLYDAVNKSSETASIIDQSGCYILTARHLVKSTEDVARRSSAWDFEFGVGPPSSNSKVSDQALASPVAWGEYDPAISIDNGHDRIAVLKNLAEDWMVMKLSACIGQTKAYGNVVLEPDSISSLIGRKLMKAGYSYTYDLRDGIPVDENCEVVGAMGTRSTESETKEMVWTHTCASLPRDSGGAIGYAGDDGKFHVVCMLNGVPTGSTDTSSQKYTPATANICIPIRAILKQIETYVQ